MKPHNKTCRTRTVLRPTSAKVREALFNILRDRITDARFLDLYAGTGVMGIEALKQGASEAVLVEAHKSSVKKIEEAIRKNRLGGRARVVSQKAVSFIERTEAGRDEFDIIFLDPPYHSDEILRALSALDRSSLLKHPGIVVAEHFIKRRLPGQFDTFHKAKEYTYGDTVLTVYTAE